MLWLEWEGGQGPIGTGQPVTRIHNLYGQDWTLYEGMNTDINVKVRSLIPDRQYTEQHFSGDMKDWLLKLVEAGRFSADAYLVTANLGYVKLLVTLSRHHWHISSWFIYWYLFTFASALNLNLEWKHSGATPTFPLTLRFSFCVMTTIIRSDTFLLTSLPQHQVLWYQVTKTLVKTATKDCLLSFDFAKVLLFSAIPICFVFFSQPGVFFFSTFIIWHRPSRRVQR